MNGFLTPAEICAFTADAGVKKAELSTVKMLVLGVLAGAFIAFAAEGSNMAAFNFLAFPETYGLGRCIAGVVFPTGLMLVVLAGGELFTGNTLMGIALAGRRIRPYPMLRNWICVYIGNFIGAVLLAHFMTYSGLFNSGAGLLGGVTVRIALGKVSLPFISAFYLGIMCNWLVCLAVWIAYGAKDMGGKILGIFCPIWLFITSGFEHSVANMYYIPAGIMAKADPAWAAASGLSSEALESLTWGAFALNNLVPVTLGNIVGGMGFVGLAYWFAYLRQEKRG
jgi:formate/nitrite transporter